MPEKNTDKIKTPKMKRAKSKSVWQRYVAHMRKQNPGQPLKKLLQNYDKADYAKFKKDPTSFVED